jgi:hypothetical protein
LNKEENLMNHNVSAYVRNHEDTPNIKKRITALLSVVVGIGLVLCSAGIANAERRGPLHHRFNHPGNILITDQFNNRVIEIEPAGAIVWHFGNGPNDVSANSIIGTNDAERVGGLTLMAGTGAPGGTEPLCPPPNGCVDNRVLLVNPQGHIIWQYGTFGVTGSGFNQLNVPVQNTYLSDPDEEEDPHVLITDQGNARVIEVRRSNKAIVWQYDGLNNPNSAELLDNDNILIADENNNQALEVTHTTPSTVVHTYTQAGGMAFSGVAFASRLPNGHTLITDSNNSRIVETDETGADFWHFFTNARPGSNPMPLPTRAVRLANGDTLISDQFNHQVIRVDSSGNIVTSYGNINQPGFGTQNVSQGMNGPYSAYVIHDYTGITPP